MKIEVTPISGTANQYTVALKSGIWRYRLAMSGTKDNASKVARDLRKSINRSGRKVKPFAISQPSTPIPAY